MLTNIILTVFVAVFVGIYVLINLNRTIFRSAFGIVTTALAAVISCILAKLTAFLLKGAAAELILGLIYKSGENVPSSINEIAGALVAAFVAPIFFVIIMIIVDIVLSLIAKPVCSLIENKQAALKTKNKLASCAIGAVTGLLTAAILLSPMAGYATMSQEFAPFATEISGNNAVTADISTDMFELIDDLADSYIAKGSLLLGGKAIVVSLTTANIDGVDFSLYIESSSIAQILDCVQLLTEKNIGSYGNFEISQLENIGNILMSDEALSTLAAKVISSAAESWQNGDDFLGIESPLSTGNSLINSDVILKSMTNYTSEDLAADVVAVTRSIRIMYENDLLGKDISSLEDIFSDDILESEELEIILAELLRSNTVSESAIATIREMLDEVLRESKDAGANVTLCDAIDAYADALSPNKLATLVSEILPIIKDAKNGASASTLISGLTPIFNDIADTRNGNAMLIQVQKAGIKLSWLKERLGISESEAKKLAEDSVANASLCAKMAGTALAEYYK